MQEEDKRTRKCGMCGPCIADNCNHECYVTYITGIYSCKWEGELEKKPRHHFCCCSLLERLFCPFILVSFFMSVLLLFIWIETSNDYAGFDWVVYLLTGRWFFWARLLLTLFALLTLYSVLLLVLGLLLIKEDYKLYLHWSHKILTLLVIGTCIFFLSLLCIHWNDRWLTFGLSLKVFAPYLHLSCVTVMVLLAWPLAYYLVSLELEAVQVAIGLPFFLILICLFVMPFGMYSPCVMEKDKLGPKPVIFGHRGAPMLGPENTIMSFQKAVENGAFGLESDVYLSFDGEPFLMHDYNLRRTTNIKEVRPNESLTGGVYFYWNFLSTLYAGKWFVQYWLRPFYNMKPLSNADKEEAKRQRIPRLKDLLRIAQKAKKYVIFDLNAPPAKHPFRNTFVRKVLNVILDSKIEHHLIYWLQSFDRRYVQEKAPDFQQVGRLYTITELRRNNIRIINVDYKKLFYHGLDDYKANNITINLYIVNEPWLFSLAWCSRIHSVTTDNIQLLRQINHPYYFMTPTYYKTLWIFLDCVSAIFIVAIFYFHWWRENQKEIDFGSTSSYIETESINLEKRETETEEAVSIAIGTPTQVGEIPETTASSTVE